MHLPPTVSRELFFESFFPIQSYPIIDTVATDDEGSTYSSESPVSPVNISDPPTSCDRTPNNTLGPEPIYGRTHRKVKPQELLSCTHGHQRHYIPSYCDLSASR
jgi:hypothetical protein